MSNLSLMLRDLIEYVSNPFPWHLAPMGYVREVRMTGRRASEIGAAWDSHLEHTRKAVIESAKLCQSPTRVVVVGAGNLLDVPLDVLTDRFDEVVLADIFHAKDTRRRVQQMSNVTLIDADVTGAARAVFDAARRQDVRSLPTSAPPVLDVGPIDLIVSVNLLSQLAVIPSSFLQGHCPGIAPEKLSAFARNLIETHLAWLSQTADQVCLVTDIVRIEQFSNGSETRKNIVEEVSLPRPDHVWDWQIAPMGSIYPDRDVYHEVQAYLNYRPSVRI